MLKHLACWLPRASAVQRLKTKLRPHRATFRQHRNPSLRAFELEATSFKVQYIQREAKKNARGRPFSALALTSYIEMALTIVVILILSWAA